MRDATQQYRAALRQHVLDPETEKMSALMGMGFLLGAEMYGAAAAIASLYAEKHGWDALPDMVKQMEKG